jgi:hypothetical protein
MKRKNKKKVVNWVLFGCTALTIAGCVYSPTTIDSICAGFCSGVFITHLLDNR